MTKSEFYNSVVKVYAETGQGVPGFLRGRAVSERDLNSLIEEGLLKIVTISFAHLPDDETICLTRGYCVEEAITRRDTTALAYVRYYKGLEQGLEKMGGPSNQQLSEDPEWLKEYNEWLEENRALLEEKIDLLPESKASDFLNEKEKEYLIGRDWFKDNLTIRECLRDSRKRTDLEREIVKTSNELIELTKNNERHKKTYENALDSKRKAEGSVKVRERIEDFLQVCPDLDMRVQNYYESQFGN